MTFISVILFLQKEAIKIKLLLLGTCFLLNTNLGQVKVYYIDTYGEFLNEVVTIEKEIGSTYETEVKNFLNYHLVRVDGNPTGTITNDLNEVYYMYDISKETVATGLKDYDLLLINIALLLLMIGVSKIYEKKNY